MNLGFQGWFLTQPHTGIGQHSIGLLRALAKHRSKPRCQVPVPAPLKIKGIPSRWLHVLPPKRWIPHASLRKWYWERVQVPQFFARVNPDWELYPYPTPLPRTSPNRRALTVHDTILWQDPRYHPRGAFARVKRAYHAATRRALVQVDHVFAVSHTTHQALNLPTATVLPNAIPELPKTLPKLDYQNALVYLGGYDLRKQVPALVKAFTKLRKKHPNLQLLLIGEPHHHSSYYPEIPATEGVHRLGKLSDKQLYAALQSALAFVHYSDAEGFNIPLLQAMSVGTPALVRDLPVNREVSDGTALFLPSAKRSLARAFSDKIEAIQNPKTRRRIVQEQKKAARRYSWDKSARALLKALKT